MYLSDKIAFFVELLKNSEGFENINVFNAYPYSYKPTELDKTTIAVMPSDLKANPAGIGSDELYGEYTIDFCVFVPRQLGSPVVNNTVEKLINAIKDCYPSSINASNIKVIERLSCFMAKCSFTFNSLMDFGGSSNE